MRRATIAVFVIAVAACSEDSTSSDFPTNGCPAGMVPSTDAPDGGKCQEDCTRAPSIGRCTLEGAECDVPYESEPTCTQVLRCDHGMWTPVEVRPSCCEDEFGCGPGPAPRCPGAVPGFSPPPYKPARRGPGKCTEAQIATVYDHCFADTSNAQTCSALDDAGSPADVDCWSCILSNESDATYGAYIGRDDVVGDLPELNFAGCVEILDDAHGLDCAKAMQANDDCQRAACADCPDALRGTTYAECVSGSGACPAFSEGVACARDEELFGPASACFLATTGRVGFIQIAGIFCGDLGLYAGVADGSADAVAADALDGE